MNGLYNWKSETPIVDELETLKYHNRVHVLRDGRVLVSVSQGVVTGPMLTVIMSPDMSTIQDTYRDNYGLLKAATTSCVLYMKYVDLYVFKVFY